MNPYSGAKNLADQVKDLSGNLSNPYANIGVATQAAEFQAEQSDMALAATLDLDWIIQGSNNTVTSNINIDGATNYMDIDGSDNTVNYTGAGVTASAGAAIAVL